MTTAASFQDSPPRWARWLGWLPHLACLVAALGVGWVVARRWVDPRFSIVVDDAMIHLTRQYLLDRLLRQGVAYPRWWPDLG